LMVLYQFAIFKIERHQKNECCPAYYVQYTEYYLKHYTYILVCDQKKRDASERLF